MFMHGPHMHQIERQEFNSKELHKSLIKIRIQWYDEECQVIY